MEGLIFLVVVYLLMKILTGGLRRAGGLRGGPPWEPPRPGEPQPAEPPGGFAFGEPPPAAAALPGPPPRDRRRAPRGEKPPARPAVPPPPPAGEEPALPGPGSLTDPRAALHGIVLAEIFGPPRCRRPYRPFPG